jgi:cytochrome c-type biogenesis protein
MLETIFDGSNVNLWIAFAAGFVTFFASCLLPLVPTYLAYLSGVALNAKGAKENRLQIMKVALFFVLGFIVTFVLLSLVINTFSLVFSSLREIMEIVGGFIFIILGLFMLGVFKHRLFSQERRLDLGKMFSERGLIGKFRVLAGILTGKPVVKEVGGFDINRFFSKYRNLHALITGVVFGFAWTPCIGPVLAVILFWSAQAGTVFDGVMLLVFYGIGLGVPFMIVSAGFEKIIPLLKRYAKVSQYVSYISGALIILAGILMMSGKFQELSFRLIDLFDLRKLSV